MSTFVGATGKKIVCRCYIDISAATTKQIKYEKPDGTDGAWDASEETTTSLSYTTTAATDLNIAGDWKFQPYVVTPTWTEHGEIDKLTVKETL